MSPATPDPDATQSAASAGRPLPITAHLAYSDEIMAGLRRAGSRPSKKQALRDAHDAVMLTLTEYLEALRQQGLVVDYASSWLLAEMVVHAPAEHATAVRQLLAERPELRQVQLDTRAGRSRLRRL